MKTIGLYEPRESGYEAVCQFARKVYWESLEFDLTNFPEFFFAIKDKTQVVGCMGLNRSTKCSLFSRDERFLRILEENDPLERFGEQSVLALKNYGLGLMPLIAIVTEYAYYIGITKIPFAGTTVALHALKRIGFDVVECGLADPDVLLPEERRNFAKWFSLNEPVLGIVDSKQAPFLSPRVFGRFANKITLAGRLAEEIKFYRMGREIPMQVPKEAVWV